MNSAFFGRDQIPPSLAGLRWGFRHPDPSSIYIYLYLYLCLSILINHALFWRDHALLFCARDPVRAPKPWLPSGLKFTSIPICFYLSLSMSIYLSISINDALLSRYPPPRSGRAPVRVSIPWPYLSIYLSIYPAKSINYAFFWRQLSLRFAAGLRRGLWHPDPPRYVNVSLYPCVPMSIYVCIYVHTPHPSD